ncbi:MAG: hypothetical protein PW791_17515 [Neorhizobium sp.]|nr:hypothetical protein [Neorhizobium sp.]
MNKIVREHYPVANLPEDLRVGLDDGARVRVVLEVEDQPVFADGAVFDFATLAERPPLTIEETRELIRQVRSQDRPSVSMDEAVSRIRALRDEWDD